jgi:hypothetical protein
MLRKSIDGQIDASFTARATFWKGETEYVLDDFKNLFSSKQFAGLAAARTTLRI